MAKRASVLWCGPLLVLLPGCHLVFPLQPSPLADAPLLTDASLLDQRAPDGSVPDHVARDGSVPDASVPDTRALDLAAPDLAGVPGTWVPIAAGSFTMGSPPGEPCREPSGPTTAETLHQVTLTHSFQIQKTEVTQKEFQAVMGYNPSHFGPNGPGPDCGGSCPVERVSWHELAAYCNGLSTKKGYAPCYQCSGSQEGVTCSEAAAHAGVAVYTCPGYRLPTEAEWEYAYRAGTTTAYYSGSNDLALCTSCSTTNSDANLDLIGWYCGNSGTTTHPSAQKQANAAGIHDLAGNVAEWSHDWHVADLGSAAVTDPVNPKSNIYRMNRGGGFDLGPQSARAAVRHGLIPGERLYRLGGRCVRTLP